jgi:hypothetical protein
MVLPVLRGSGGTSTRTGSDWYHGTTAPVPGVLLRIALAPFVGTGLLVVQCCLCWWCQVPLLLREP